MERKHPAIDDLGGPVRTGQPLAYARGSESALRAVTPAGHGRERLQVETKLPAAEDMGCMGGCTERRLKKGHTEQPAGK
ncbi:MAG: hypothetical protein ABI165_20120 [Bryobacteraceae bacterium]